MLTAAKINNAKPKVKSYKLGDALGLYLFVSPSGGKLWRMKYRFEKKEKLLSFGPYPEISLVQAREKRDAARKLLALGEDPGKIKTERPIESLECIVKEWHEKFLSSWSPDYAAAVYDRLEQNVLPWLGSRAISEIRPIDLLSVLRRIEARGAMETVRRVKVICGQVWRFAVATGRADRDITVDLRGAFAPAIKKHYAALTRPEDVGGLLRAIDGYSGSFVVKCALQLAPLVFVRPGELRHGEWSEINIDIGMWEIPVSKMKMKQSHLVPLSRQAQEIIVALKPLTGRGRYLFPSMRSSQRPMSENTIRMALMALGYSNEQMTCHGFRAMARTMLDEVLHVREAYIEQQLAHSVKDPNGRAYNRTAHLEERKNMMQLWADYLDELRRSK